MRTLKYYIEKCDQQRNRIAELEAQNEKLTSRGFVGAQEQIIARLRARLAAVAAAARLVVDDPVQINLQRLEQALEQKDG